MRYEYFNENTTSFDDLMLQHDSMTEGVLKHAPIQVSRKFYDEFISLFFSICGNAKMLGI